MENDEPKLTHWKRVTYALALSTLLSGIIIMSSAAFAPDLMLAYITEPYVVFVFVLAYLFAPWLSRYIKEK